MPEQWIRAVVTIPSTTGLVENAVQNVLHFRDTVGGQSTTELDTPLSNFFNLALASPVEVPIAGYLSGELSRAANAVTVDYYNVPLTAGPVGAPIRSSAFTLGAMSGSAKSLPSEVSCCLSLDATLLPIETEPESIPGGAPGPAGDTHPRARRRGRIYLGPLNDTATNATGGGTSAIRPSSAFRSSVTRSAKENLAAAVTSAGWIWAVFSPTAWAMGTIHHVWVDDAFDTQRRRGVAATARTTLAL